MCAGNPAMHFYSIAVFCKCAKRRKTKKVKDYLKTCISGMASLIYFKYIT